MSISISISICMCVYIYIKHIELTLPFMLVGGVRAQFSLYTILLSSILYGV